MLRAQRPPILPYFVSTPETNTLRHMADGAGVVTRVRRREHPWRARYVRGAPASRRRACDITRAGDWPTCTKARLRAVERLEVAVRTARDPSAIT